MADPLNSILEDWRKDCKIDNVMLDKESLNIPFLHGKYLKRLSDAKMKHKLVQSSHDQLYATITDYYKGNLNNPEDLAEIGRDPWDQVLTNSGVEKRVIADKEIIESQLKVAYQQQLIDMLQEIIKSINSRGFIISNAIKWRQLTQFGDV